MLKSKCASCGVIPERRKYFGDFLKQGPVVYECKCRDFIFCPKCHSGLKRQENELDVYCSNTACRWEGYIN